MAREHFYLDKANGKLAGVCAGLADYTQVDVLWVRLLVVFLTIFAIPFITVPAYVVAALTANKRPGSLYSPEEEDRLLRRLDRSRSTSHYRTELSDMSRRVAEMEARYGTSNARLAAEIDSLR